MRTKKELVCLIIGLALASAGSAQAECPASMVGYWALNDGALLAEDFDDGVADGWIPLSGEWSLAGGEYVGVGSWSAQVNAVSLSPAEAADGRMSAKVKVMTHADDDAGL
ncbi:MAG: hypothetical protein ABII00_08385, partial [Elusimicrobiota bacterium]